MVILIIRACVHIILHYDIKTLVQILCHMAYLADTYEHAV